MHPNQVTGIGNTQPASLNPQQHVEPVEFLLAHRQHSHDDSPGPRNSKECLYLAEGCHLYVGQTRHSCHHMQSSRPGWDAKKVGRLVPIRMEFYLLRPKGRHLQGVAKRSVGLVQNWGCQCVPDIFAPVLGPGVGRGVDFEVGGSRGRGSLRGHHGDQQA